MKMKMICLLLFYILSVASSVSFSNLLLRNTQDALQSATVTTELDTVNDVGSCRALLKLKTGEDIFLYEQGGKIKLASGGTDLSSISLEEKEILDCSSSPYTSCKFRAVAFDNTSSYDFLIVVNTSTGGKGLYYTMAAMVPVPTVQKESPFSQCQATEEIFLSSKGVIILRCSTPLGFYAFNSQDMTQTKGSTTSEGWPAAVVDDTTLVYVKKCAVPTVTFATLSIENQLNTSSQGEFTVSSNHCFNQFLYFKFEGVSFIMFTSKAFSGTAGTLEVKMLKMTGKFVTTLYYATVSANPTSLFLFKVSDRKIGLFVKIVNYQFLVIDIISKQVNTLLLNTDTIPPDLFDKSIVYGKGYQLGNSLAFINHPPLQRIDLTPLYQKYPDPAAICNSQTVFDFPNFQCISACPETAPFINERRICASTCASGYVLETELPYTCSTIQSCPYGSYSYATTVNGEKLTLCKSACPAGTDIDPDDLKCLTTCPSSAPFNNNGICGTSCDGSFFISVGATSIFYKCLTQCPSIYPFTIPAAESKLSYNECVKSCPAPYYVYNNTCLKKCPKYTKNEGYTCKNCKNEGKFFLSGTCVDSLGYNTILLDRDFAAYGSCSGKLPLAFNGVCVDTCPANYYKYNGYQCVDLFIDHKFLNEGRAVDDCPSGKLVNSKRECYTCQEKNMLTEKGECVQNCSSNYYNSTNQCYSCSEPDYNNKYFFQQCVWTCSSEQNPCKNGGMCSYSGEVITCTCAAAYVGEYCQYSRTELDNLIVNFNKDLTTALEYVKNTTQGVNSLVKVNATHINNHLVTLKWMFPYMNATVPIQIADRIIELVTNYDLYDTSIAVPDYILFNFLDFAVMYYDMEEETTQKSENAFKLVNKLANRVFSYYANSSSGKISDFVPLNNSHFAVRLVNATGVYLAAVNAAKNKTNTTTTNSTTTNSTTTNKTTVNGTTTNATTTNKTTLRDLQTSTTQSFSYINYTECMKIYISENNNSSSLVLLQTDYFANANSSYAVSFDFYKDYKLFNMTAYCLLKNAPIKVMIPVTSSYIDLTLFAKYLNNTPPINYYNSKDMFYTDRCYSYVNTSSGFEVSLTSRITTLAPKYYIDCGVGCIYQNITVASKYISCQCDSTNQAKMTLLPFPTDVHFQLNFDIFRCTDKIFDAAILRTNIGFYLYGSFLFIAAVMMILFRVTCDRKGTVLVTHGDLEKVIKYEGSCIKVVNKSFAIEMIKFDDKEKKEPKQQGKPANENMNLNLTNKSRPYEPQHALDINIVPQSEPAFDVNIKDKVFLHEIDLINNQASDSYYNQHAHQDEILDNNDPDLQIVKQNSLSIDHPELNNQYIADDQSSERLSLQVQQIEGACLSFSAHKDDAVSLHQIELKEGGNSDEKNPLSPPPTQKTEKASSPTKYVVKYKDEKKLTGITLTDVTEMSLDVVLEEDTRTTAKYFLDLVFFYHPFWTALRVKSILKPRTLRIMSLVLSISLVFFFNAIFFYDGYMDELNYNLGKASKDSIGITIATRLSKTIYSVLVTLGIMGFVNYFLYPVREYKTEYNQSLLQCRRKNVLDKVDKGAVLFFQRMRLRHITFIIITIVFFVISFYFCMSFCAVYPNFAKSWIYDGVTTFVYNYFITQVITYFLHTVIRQHAKKWSNSTVLKVIYQMFLMSLVFSA